MASAGTGKTFTLTNRMAGLLARGVPAERILAATFTRKAAGEIRERLLSRIARAAVDERAAIELSEHAGVALDSRGWIGSLRRLSRSIHRVRIGTLDSLAQSLARSLAPELGLATPWRTAMDHSGEQLRTDVVERVLGELQDGEDLELLRVLAGAEASARGDRKLADLLRDAGPALRRAERDAWACLAEEAQHGPSLEAVNAAIDRLRSLPGPVNKSGKPNQHFVKAIDAIAQDVHNGDFERLLARSLIANCRAPEPTYFKICVPPEWLPQLQSVLGGVVRAEIGKLHERNLAAGRLVRRAFEIDDAVRREQRTYALDDLWRALAQTDLDTQQVSYRLDARFDHILLDEFQDTSIDQWRVLEPLIDEAVAGGERDRSVFVVGDVKQSLYGWRNAQAALLPYVARRWPQMRVDSLKVTYRCAPEIVLAVNRLFSALPQNEALAAHADAVARFAEEFDAHESAVEPGAKVRVVDTSTRLAADADDDALATFVAERVAAVNAQRPEAEIAVLIRRQKPIGRIVAALAKLGVRAVADASSSPCDHPAVEAVLAALHLAEHPGDGPARYAVAHSPLGGELGYTAWDDQAAAARLAQRVSGWVFELGVARAVERLTRDAAQEANARGRQRLADLVAQAEAYEAETPQWVGVDDFIQFARRARVRPHGRGTVRVLTLHGAKGLQFDAVFLADLDASLAKRPPAFLADAQGREDADPAAAPSRLSLSSVQGVRAHSAVLREMEARWRTQSVYEELCLLYVGMTRAKRHLEILVDGSGTGIGAAAWGGLAMGEPETSGEGEIELGSDDWLAGRVGQEIAAERVTAPVWARPEATSERWSLPREPWRVAIVQPSRLGTCGDVAQLLAPAGEAADLGSDIHRLLEAVTWLEDASDDPGRWVGPSDHVSGEAVARVRAALRDESLRAALSREAMAKQWGPDMELSVRREVSLAVPVQIRGRPVLIRGRIDRLVFGRRNGRVERCQVFDFKTGRSEDAGEAQLEAYRQAVSRQFGIDPGLVECVLVPVWASEAE